MAKDESKFWQEVKKNIKQISFTRLEAKALDPLAIKLYEGRDILKLVSREPCTPVAESWTKVQEYLVNVT
jgi:hypothetical protein